MHLIIASFACYFLLFTEGHAASHEGFKTRENVPEIAEKALVSAIEEQRKEMYGLSDPIAYNYQLAKKAVDGKYGTWTLSILDFESVPFENSWNETLKRAVASRSNGMINAAETIGCQITLTTSTSDGSHKLKLYCLLGNKNGDPLKFSSN